MVVSGGSNLLAFGAFFVLVELLAGATLPQPLEVDQKLDLLGLDECGIDAYPNEQESLKPVFNGYPWVGLLEYNFGGKTRYCHATLISERYLIAPAHCVISSKYKPSTVRLGEYDMTSNTDCEIIDGNLECAPPIQRLGIDSIIAHTSYKKNSFAYDIALVRLRDPADTTKPNVKPICLPFSKELRSFKPSVLTLTAWEKARNASKIERSMRRVVDSVECQEMYDKHSIKLGKSKSEFCAKEQTTSVKKCFFPNAGAPLQVMQNVRGSQRYVLRGILSFGANKCNTKYPDIYTNIGSFIEWILSHIDA